MKYKIEFSFRARGIQLLKVTDEEKENLFETDDLEQTYFEMVDEKDYDFELEDAFLTKNVDRFSLVVKDESGEIIYESDDVEDLLKKDMTDIFNEDDGAALGGWKFKGIKDGTYLVDVQTLKGNYITGELDIDGEFDPDRLYIIKSTELDDELTGEDMFSTSLYYKREETPNLEKDYIDLDWMDYGEEQYWDIYLMNVEYGNEWMNLLD